MKYLSYFLEALFILLLSVSLWVTEAIPAFSVGILVIGLQIALLGDHQEGIFAMARHAEHQCLRAGEREKGGHRGHGRPEIAQTHGVFG